MRKILASILLIIPTISFAIVDQNCTFTATGFGNSQYNGAYTIGGEYNYQNYYINANSKKLYIDPNNAGNWLLDVTLGNTSNQAYYLTGSNGYPTAGTFTYYTGDGTAPGGNFATTTVPCTTETETATSTATSTTSTGDLAFGITIIISLLSLGLVGFAFNTINSKKPWQ